MENQASYIILIQQFDKSTGEKYKYDIILQTGCNTLNDVNKFFQEKEDDYAREVCGQLENKIVLTLLKETKSYNKISESEIY